MSFMVTVYKKMNYKIYSDKNGYIVHNTRLNFDQHHTHINNYNTCKFIIDLCIHKSTPRHLSDYLLVSLLRLTDDKKYKDSIYSILNKSNKKKNKSYNNSKNIPKDINRKGKKNEKNESWRTSTRNSKR